MAALLSFACCWCCVLHKYFICVLTTIASSSIIWVVLCFTVFQAKDRNYKSVRWRLSHLAFQRQRHGMAFIQQHFLHNTSKQKHKQSHIQFMCRNWGRRLAAHTFAQWKWSPGTARGPRASGGDSGRPSGPRFDGSCKWTPFVDLSCWPWSRDQVVLCPLFGRPVDHLPLSVLLPDWILSFSSLLTRPTNLASLWTNSL